MNFLNGTFTGLGQVLLIAIFLQENDLKNGNVGLNIHNRVVKIDGNWCFAGLTNKEPYPITSSIIEELPYAKDFGCFHWLDLIRANKTRLLSSIIDVPRQRNLPSFQAEINQAMLMICLLPDDFIIFFVTLYTAKDDIHQFVDLILERRNQIREVALQNKSFNAYIKTSEAICDANAILQQMQTFRIGNVPIINNSQRRILEIKFPSMLDPIFPVIRESRRLLEELIPFAAHDVELGSLIKSFQYNLLNRLNLYSNQYEISCALNYYKNNPKPSHFLPEVKTLANSKHNFWHNVTEEYFTDFRCEDSQQNVTGLKKDIEMESDAYEQNNPWF